MERSLAMFQQITIIGVGLIGGSLARAAKVAGLCHEIVGCSRNQSHLETALSLGVIDRYEMDIGAAVKEADLVVVAVPLGAMRAVFDAMKDHLKPEAIITDVGSAKASVVAAAGDTLDAHLPYFVPAHPIAGTENSGVEASFSTLFDGHMVILTPIDDGDCKTDAKALASVRSLWQATGADVRDMSISHHDEVLAATSHLPQLLAYSLVDTLSKMSDRDEIFQYAAGGFRDLPVSHPVIRWSGVISVWLIARLLCLCWIVFRQILNN